MRQYEFKADPEKSGDESISISDRPKRRLDLFARIVCLVVALVIWLWMVNFNDTDVTATMVLKIGYEGIEDLERDGMMIYGFDKNEIAVTVKGSNRDIRKYSSEEYKVSVDVGEIAGVGKFTLPLKVTTPSGSSLSLVESEPLNVTLMADIKSTKTVAFDVLVSGIQDAGMIRYSYESEQTVSEIEVSGPKTVMDMISSARFNVNGSFVTTTDEMSFSDFPLMFLDKNFNEVVVDAAAMEYSTDEVTVNIRTIAHKSIPVSISVKGEGSELVAKPSVDSVEIWGTPSKVKSTDYYPIVIDKAEVGKTATYTVTNEDFPSGINVKENVTIIISFEEPMS